eukprot:scaffold224563_cov31-Tisochrysis_lutea.AAC.2
MLTLILLSSGKIGVLNGYQSSSLSSSRSGDAWAAMRRRAVYRPSKPSTRAGSATIQVSTNPSTTL